MSTATLGALTGPLQNPLGIGIKTPTPSVFIIPPEEEQEENPPWCCYDPENPDAAMAYNNPSAGTASNDVEFVTELELDSDQNWNGDDDSPVFRRSDSRPLDEIAVMPRKASRSSVYFESGTDERVREGLRVSGAMDVDDDVVEVVRVGRRRVVEAEAYDLQEDTKGDTWKKAKGLTFRARAAQAFKSMRNVSSGSVKNDVTKADRRHVKEVFRPVENQSEKSGPGPVRRMSMAKLARRNSKAASVRRSQDVLATPVETANAKRPSASFDAPRSTSTKTLSRRLSQLFVSQGRSSTDLTRPQSPPSSGPLLSRSSSDLADIAMGDTSPSVQPEFRRESQDNLGLETRPILPGLQPERQPTRRLSVRGLKNMFTRDAGNSAASGISASQSAPIVPVSMSSSSTDTDPYSIRSPASSSYSPYIGMGSPTFPTSPVLMSRDSRTVSDASTEPPETPKDSIRRFSFGRDRPGRSSFSASRISAEAAAKVDMDENLEMRLDSLHFDSIHFDPGEFEVSF